MARCCCCARHDQNAILKSLAGFGVWKCYSPTPCFTTFEAMLVALRQGCWAPPRLPAPGASRAGSRRVPASPARCQARGPPPLSAAASSAGLGLEPSLSQYPAIDLGFPGLEVVHAEPPVFVAHGFLSQEECDQLIASAAQGQLQEVEYDQSMLLDRDRLWPLSLVALAGAAFDTWQQAPAGASAALPLDGVAAAALLPLALVGLAKWALLLGCVVGGVQVAMPLVLGRVFTGTKWTTAGIPESHPAAGAVQRFVTQVSQLAQVAPSRLEVPTVTRYEAGQYQRAHYDGRPAGDPQGLEKWRAAGGQRLMQVVVYLNTLSPEQQGGTHFHHPQLGSLTVQPQKGDALAFFPALADGQLDDRMLHSGLAVRGEGGVEKWIVNTWVCQFPPFSRGGGKSRA